MAGRGANELAKYLGKVGMEAEILGSLWVVDFPPCNFWIHQLISSRLEQRGGGLGNT